MAEPRKIVLILGNGFDLDLGLKTSYKDFWQSEFCPKSFPAPLIAHLNEKWGDNLEEVKWYDLENQLFIYYRDIVSKGKRKDIIDEYEATFLKIVKPELWHWGTYNEYVEQAQSLFDKGFITFDDTFHKLMRIPYHKEMLESPELRDRRALELIKEGLCKYLKSIHGQPFISNSIALNVLYAANCAREAGNFLSIYTFNYTPLPVDYGNGFQKVVHYVHGDCENGKVIIGTKDDGEYDNNYDFFQKAFDPNFNPPALVADLLDADEVIIFGHSIGENDRQYFKSFFKQQTDYVTARGKDITIFTWDDHSEVEIKRSLQKMTDNNLSTLYGLNHVEIIKTSIIKERSESINAFLSKHICDNVQVSALLHKLLRSDG
ncbi:MAG: hypothetical protein IJ611_06065 [Bacteroidales bacterium]|nr:hypothetical protein [Bacteroidales bacterium]